MACGDEKPSSFFGYAGAFGKPPHALAYAITHNALRSLRHMFITAGSGFGCCNEP